MEYANGEVNHLVWITNENRYHHEEEGLTLDNPNVNIAILGRQILDGSCVLDVGCGEGKLAALMQEKNCNLYAVDIDERAIEYAKLKKRYKDAFVLDIENPERNQEEYNRFLSMGVQFDYVVLADVLEHSVNPTKVLCGMTKYLKYDGKVLISIPNVNNADIILNLLRGRFNYMQSGILDNTHTKYFTKISFVEWIDEVNNQDMDYCFDCEYLGGIYGLTQHMEDVRRDMPQLFQFLQLNPEYSTIQNLFVLTKYKKPHEQPNLQELLRQERVDLAKILADYLKNGMTSDYIDEVGNIKLLDNEREILEERVNSAEEGWKRADEKITELYSAIDEVKKGWKEADEKLQEAVEGWKKADAVKNQQCVDFEEERKRAKSDLIKLSKKNTELQEELNRYKSTMLYKIYNKFGKRGDSK